MLAFPAGGQASSMEQSALIERFHEVLVEAIRERAPTYLDSRFTVADIYQFLIPYRTHRDRLGVAMNGDYEDTLLRLLAGDGEFLILDSEPARRRIREELRTGNPHTGIYREFAAVEVRLNPSQLREGPRASRPGNGGPLAGAAETIGVGLTVEPREAPIPPNELGQILNSPADGPAPRASVEGELSTDIPSNPSSCPDCSQPLPIRESVRFCPHCGANTLERPCGSCGEILNRGWKFCVACGQPTAG